MSQPFAFPPPPPPPPKRDHASNPYSQPLQNTNYSRGRGGGNSNFRGGHAQRGSFSRGGGRGYAVSNYRGNHNSSTYTPHNNSAHGQSNEQRGFHPSRVHNGQASPSNTQKRNHESAFDPGNIRQNAKPKAPPAVPSFNLDIGALLPGRTDSTLLKPAPSRKGNSLGLTPQQEEAESESDGQDDEAKLAATMGGDSISFEHRGQKLSLSTPAEIAAWIAERRSKFPTQEKAEAAKKVAEEKKRTWQEQKQANAQAAKLRQEQRDKNRQERDVKRLKEKLIAAQVQKSKAAVANAKIDTTEKAREKAERLRKRAGRANEQLQAAEIALKEAQLLQHGQPSGVIEDVDVDAESPSTSEEDDTSSSGSSDSDDDSDTSSAPEESSSKRDGPERVPPPTRTDKRWDTQLCRTLIKTGRCKFGKKCHFSHETPERTKPNSTKQTGTATSRRKGLYQIMVDKEQEEARKQALQVIVALGKQGLLDVETNEAGSLMSSEVG